jgi:hypothetical protein
MVQPLPDLQVLDESSSQPGSHAVELEENLRSPLAVLEDFVLIDVSILPSCWHKIYIY